MLRVLGLRSLIVNKLWKAPGSSLIVAWGISLLAGEWFIFHVAYWRCSWHKASYDGNPRRSNSRRAVNWRKPSKVAVISDPQITDSYSYQNVKSGALLSLIQFYSDLYMKRCYQLLISYLKPDHVIFLGDVFDGGREWNDNLFEEEMTRFSRIFPAHDGITTLFVAGNHDIGIGRSVVLSAAGRFKERFGEMNYLKRIGSHELVVVNSLAVGVEAEPTMKGEVDRFLESLKKTSPGEKPLPRLLFSHVPLFRPDNSPCGALRTSGHALRQGAGYQYQNLVDLRQTENLLSVVKPFMVLSGDDHEWCEYVHQKFDVNEYTVGTFSWLQGNRYPSFGMLTLYSPFENTTASEQYLDACFLPSQINIYIGYLVLAAITLLYCFLLPILSCPLRIMLDQNCSWLPFLASDDSIRSRLMSASSLPIETHRKKLSCIDCVRKGILTFTRIISFAGALYLWLLSATFIF